MDRRRYWRGRWAWMVGSLLLLLVRVAGAATLSISPDSIATDYRGEVALTIAGIPAGAGVRVELVLDQDANGAVGSGEPLMLSFEIVDGEALHFGGVRIPFVPGDEDEIADGTIHARLVIPALPEILRFAAKWVYRVSASTDGFDPIQASFTTTQPAYGQKIQGVVRDSGTPVALAYVFAQPEKGGPLAGIQSGADGSFSLNVPTGTFGLVALKPGRLADLTSTPQLNVGSGASLVQDVTLGPADRTIRGRVTDSFQHTPMPGVLILAQSVERGFLGMGFSDADGNFEVGTSHAAATWRLDPSYRSAAMLGYLSLQDGVAVDTAGEDLSGVSLRWPRATAAVYGWLRDTDGQSLPWLDIRPQADGFQSVGVTDADGRFAVAVTAGTWSVGADSDQLGMLGLAVPDQRVSLRYDEALRVDLTARRLTARLRGRVVDDTGARVPNICLSIRSENSGQVASTDSEGNFDFGVFGGTWSLSLCREDAQARQLLGPSLQVMVTDGVDVNGVVYPAKRVTAYLHGQVRAADTTALANINVSTGTSLGGSAFGVSQRTDAAGHYELGVFAGSWQVQLECEDLRVRGYQCSVPAQVTLAPGEHVGLDFLVQPVAPLVITSASPLADGMVSQNYVVDLSGSGGTPPYTWAIGGGRLPYDMGLSSYGRIGGVPRESGAFSFTVVLTDSIGQQTQKLFALFVGSLPLRMETMTLPSFHVGDMPWQILQASGGVPYYEWRVTAGALPPGMLLSTNGTLSGLLTVSGSFTFTIRVEDRAQGYVDREFTLRVDPAAPTATPTRAPTGPSPTPTATPQACLGDCDGNAVVHVEEVVRGVNLVVSQVTPLACAGFDCRRPGGGSMACLVEGLGHALAGCLVP